MASPKSPAPLNGIIVHYPNTTTQFPTLNGKAVLNGQHKAGCNKMSDNSGGSGEERVEGTVKMANGPSNALVNHKQQQQRNLLLQKKDSIGVPPLQLNATQNAAYVNSPAPSSTNSDDAGCSSSRKPSASPSISGTESAPNSATPGAAAAQQPLLHQKSQAALLYVPEQRRISTVSGHSVRSCPSEIYKDGATGGGHGSGEGSPVVEQATVEGSEEADEEADEFQVLIHSPSNSTGQSRNASPRAQAACEAYSRVYGSGALLFGGHDQHGQRLSVGSSRQARHQERSPPHSNGSGNSPPDLSRRRSVHTGAPAIAFRSSLCFAAAVAGANCGKIAAIPTVQPTPSVRYPPRHRPFQRRSSQPIINVATGVAAPGVAFHCHRQQIRQGFPMNHLQGLKGSQQQQQQQHRFSVGQVNAAEESGAGSSTNGGEPSTPGIATVPAMSKRVSWLSMKSLQDCSHQLHGADSSSGVFRPKKRDSGVLIETSSGKDSKLCDTRSNSQLGSLLQLNNSSTLFGGQDDMTTLGGGYDPLECPDTPPIDTMSWSNMGKSYCRKLKEQSFSSFSSSSFFFLNLISNSKY